MSCLFNALEKYLHVPSARIRSTVCDYLDANKFLLEGMETVEVLKTIDDRYVENMRQDTTFGSAIEISVVCRLWGVNIEVKDANANRVVLFDINESPVCRCVLYWNGGHYWS